MPDMATLASSSADSPLTATERVYHIPELLQRILQLLDRKGLASFMRVRKESMEAVARELYHTVNQRHIHKLSSRTEHGRIYLSAVSTIIICPSCINQADSRKVGLLHLGYGYDSLARWLGSYSMETFDVVVPPLRARCSRLKRIEFGRRSHELGSWVVTFHSSPSHSVIGTDAGTSGSIGATADVDGARSTPSASFNNTSVVDLGVESGHTSYADEASTSFRFLLDLSSTESATETEDATDTMTNIGHIAYAQYVNFPIHRAPPAASLSKAPLPPPGYTIHTSYICKLYDVERDPPHEGWTNAISENSDFDRCESIPLDIVPITLDQLANLYERQVNSVRGDRLERISAHCVAPWELADTDRFARVASTSLVSLDINSETSSITFSLFPALYDILRVYTPNLRELALSIEMTDEEGLVLLSPAILDTGGRLTSFNISIPRTARPKLTILDCLRLMSPYVTSDASVSISLWDNGRSEDIHKEALKYLRSQAPHRRAHLGTADFASLGVCERTIGELEYYEDGRPKSRVVSKAAKWVDKAHDSSALETLSWFSEILAEIATASVQLERRTISGTSAQTLEAMRELLEWVECIGESASGLHGIISAGGRMEQDIKAMIKILAAKQELVKEGDAVAEGSGGE